jgi:dihydrofolate reductase
MRTLAVTQNITLDGRIEMLDDWFDPGDQDEEMLDQLRREDEQCDGLLLGRQTFEDFRGYWPQQTDDATGITDQLNRVHKYVYSSTMTDPEWVNSTVLTGDLATVVGELKAREGRDIVVTGSIRLTHALLEAGLVDEIRLYAYPVVQGRGRRLFPEGFAAPRLRLVEGKAFTVGVTYSAYRLS